MWLKNIQILNFRNFSRLDLNFSPHVNILEGENAQGKTNLMEAIHCTGCGFSFRTYEEQNLIQWDQDSFYLGGEGKKRDVFSKFELSLAKNSPKVRRVNSHRVSLRDVSRWLWMVVFSMQDIKIVQEGPSYRRNFLDEVATFVYPDFSYIRSSFNRVLNQRNNLLGQYIKKKQVFSQEMEAWDKQFLKLSSEIVYLRLKILKKLTLSLSKIYPQIYPHLKGGAYDTQLTYNSSFLEAQADDFSLQKIKENFYLKLKEVKRKEMEQGISLIGPHRDDFNVKVNGIDQRIFGSRGEQRIAATALRLAEITLIEEREDESPVILLDDIPGELDARCEGFLLNMVKGTSQVFIATQDTSRFDSDFLNKSRVFSVTRGVVVKK